MLKLGNQSWGIPNLNVFFLTLLGRTSVVLNYIWQKTEGLHRNLSIQICFVYSLTQSIQSNISNVCLPLSLSWTRANLTPAGPALSSIWISLICWSHMFAPGLLDKLQSHHNLTPWETVFLTRQITQMGCLIYWQTFHKFMTPLVWPIIMSLDAIIITLCTLTIGNTKLLWLNPVETCKNPVWLTPHLIQSRKWHWRHLLILQGCHNTTV